MANLTCHICGRALSAKDTGTCQYTRGWVKVRSGGGGNAVHLPDREPYFAHYECVKRRIAGWDRRQTTLWDDDQIARMSKPPDIEPLPTNAGFDGPMLLHVCNVCGGEAPYGIGVAIGTKGLLGQWYCHKHLPPPPEVHI